MAEPALDYPTDIESFLAWEQRQPERYELVAGVVRMMVGATLGHDAIADNIHFSLASRLRGAPCRAWRGDTKVRAPNGQIMYPDVLVSCTPRGREEIVIDDPVLVVEVLSPSTERHDSTTKRWAYQAIPSLRQLLIVDQGEARAELMTREAGETWRTVIITGLAASLPLASLDIELPMAEIYEDIDFSSDTPPSKG